MSFTIKEITDRNSWNVFVDSLNPNTFLHSWEWGQLQLATGEGVRYLGFFRGGQQVGAALIILVKAKRGCFYLCPHGPLFVLEADVLSALPGLINYLKKYAAGDKAVAIKIAPLLLAAPENQVAFSALGFRPAPLHIHTELTWVRDIALSEEEILRDMRKTTRHAIKKAQQAGVKVDIVTDVASLERFLPLYSTTTSRHGFVPFTKDFLTQQVKMFSEQNRLYIAIAQNQGKDVAGAILVHTGKTVFYHHGASLHGSTATQLLQWEAMREAKRRGATRYNFWGIAPDNQPKHPFAGITVFKKGFGGYAMDYMHAQDLPLSIGYWPLWAVDMYRKYKRGFK